MRISDWSSDVCSSDLEKFIIDADQLGLMQTFCAGYDLSENGQAMDALREVGPGSHFLGCSHTRANFESAFWRSSVADNNSFEQREAEGGRDVYQRANGMWKKMLDGYEAPPPDPGDAEALQDFIADKKATTDEPLAEGPLQLQQIGHAG